MSRAIAHQVPRVWGSEQWHERKRRNMTFNFKDRVTRPVENVRIVTYCA